MTILSRSSSERGRRLSLVGTVGFIRQIFTRMGDFVKYHQYNSPMADVTIPSGQFLTFVFAGNGPIGGGGTPEAIQFGSGSISLSPADYARAYVVALGVDTATGGQKIAVVPRASAPPPVGGSINIALTCNARDAASGNSLNQFTGVIQINGAAPQPALAQNVGWFNQTFAALSTAPADPGSNTITF